MVRKFCQIEWILCEGLLGNLCICKINLQVVELEKLFVFLLKKGIPMHQTLWRISKCVKEIC